MATRVKKATTDSLLIDEITTSTPVKTTKVISSAASELENLVEKLLAQKRELEKLEQEMDQAKQAWGKEQIDHNVQTRERDTQEEVAKKREQETYDYETKLARKKTEDEFTYRKLQWENELNQRKDELAGEKRELEELRKKTATFEEQSEKVVAEARTALQKELSEKFETEKRLRDQEQKSALEILNLQIKNLSEENARQTKEIETLKHAFDDATRQVKDIAVRVIDSTRPQIDHPPAAT